MSLIYPGGDEQVTPNLGLATWGMDEVLAENMILIDAAVGSGGTTVEVNGVTVANPNFNDTTPAAPAGNANVTWQKDISGNVSAYVSTSGGGVVTSVFGRIGDVVAHNDDYNGVANLKMLDASQDGMNVDTTNQTIQIQGNNQATFTTGGPRLTLDNNGLQPSFNLDSGGDVFLTASADGTTLTSTADSVVFNTINSGTGVTFSAGTALVDGTGTPGTSGQILSSTITGVKWIAAPTGFVNPMTTLGDIIYENAVPAATRLAGNITTTKLMLSQTGTGAISAAPVWAALVSGDIPNNAANTSGTAANLSGTPALPNGTTATTQTVGDNTTKLATDAFVATGLAALAALKQNVLTGTGIARNTGACTELSGDVTTSGSNAATLKSVGTAGTYTKVTTDAQGRVTSGAAVTLADITAIAGGTIVGNNTTGSASPSASIAPVLGIPGTSTGTIALASSTASGKFTITAPASASTPTLTLPTLSGTVATQFAGDGVVLTATINNASAGGTLTASLANAAGGTVLGNSGTTPTTPGYLTRPQLGIPGTSTGTIALASATASGLFTITAPASASTPTLTLPTTSNVLAGQIAGDGTIFATSLVVASAAGTITLPTPQNQTANLVFAGPTSGGAAAPTFRAIVAADIPSGSVIWNAIGNATGALTLANAGNATTFNQTSTVVWTWANTTAATNLGVNASSPQHTLSGTYFTLGASATDSWSYQNSIATAHISSTVTNVVETAGSAVILTITGGNFAVGDVVTFTGLTTATWLNGQNATLTSAVATSLSFIDPTSHGTQVSTPETGQVTQANPVSSLIFTHSGSAAATVQFPNGTASLGGISFPAGTGISGNGQGTTRLVSSATACELQFNTTQAVSLQGTVGIGVNTGLGTGYAELKGASAVGLSFAGNIVGPLGSPAVIVGSASALNTITGTQVAVALGVPTGTNNHGIITFAPAQGTAKFTAFQVNPTVNQALQVTNTIVGVALVTNVVAVVFSTANAYTAGTVLNVNAVTNTAINGTPTLVAQGFRAGSPYTITNSVENSSSVVTLTIGTHSVVANDWVFLTGLTTATWLNNQVVKVTSVVGNTSITFTDLSTHGTSATHADTGTVTDNFATFALTHANITGINDTGTVTQQGVGNYIGALVNVVESALGGTANKLLSLQAGASGGTIELDVSNTGIVTTYGGIATVSNGVPSELATLDLTAQSAAKTATTLYATTATGMYRVSWSATITTAGTTSILGGTNGFQVLYTSPTDSVVKTTVPGNSITTTANTTGTAVGGCEVVYAKTGTNIQFTYDYTSTGTTMVYELHVKVEAL